MRLENIVLGQAVNNPEDFDELAQYVPNGDVFVQGRARRLWEKVGGMLREDKPISLITVISALTSYDEDKGVTSSYVVDATTAAACSTGIKDMTHAKLMYEKYMLRRVLGEAQKIESLARNNSGKVYDIRIKA
jgi:replicative DNA helicase